MEKQLKVVKADGSVEDYFHTKVIGTLSNALAAAGQGDVEVAEQFADVVTYFLYGKNERNRVTSGEIFSVTKAVLTTTHYDQAAISLDEHYFSRKLGRRRVEVAHIEILEAADIEQLGKDRETLRRSRWNKSRIVESLVVRQGVERQSARAIAAMVEEKVLNMGVSLVPVSLIRQLVFADMALVLRAEHELLAV